MSSPNLHEVFKQEIFNQFFKDLCGLSCAFYLPTGELFHFIGSGGITVRLSDEERKDILKSYLPVDVDGARVSAIQVQGEAGAYAVIETKGDEDAFKADFAFQLMNLVLVWKESEESLKFDVGYLTYILNLIRETTQKTASIFDPVELATRFITDCEKIFGIGNGGIYRFSTRAEVLASVGDPPDPDLVRIRMKDSGKLLVLSDGGGESAPSLMMAPLFSGEELIGAICLKSGIRGEFSRQDQSVLQTLAVSFGARFSNILLHEALLRDQAMKAEVELAQKVQSLLIPPELIHTLSFNIYSVSVPATQCGGDWWGYHEVILEDGSHHLILALGDVSGHGIAAALVTGVAQGCFTAICSSLGRLQTPPDPMDLIRHFNRSVYESTHGSVHMTMFLAVISPAEGIVRYVNAGHTHPYLVTGAGADALTQPLAGIGQPLGYAAVFQDLSVSSVSLPEGARLFVYSDGLIDCVVEGRNRFPSKQLRQVLGDSSVQESRSLLATVMKERRQIAGTRVDQDDITALICDWARNS